MKEKKHRASRRKKDTALRRRWRAGNKCAHKHFISGGRLFGLLPDLILEGVGDSLLTAADRYAYTVNVPRMYNIVGREQLEALCSEKWQEAWETPRQQQAVRTAQEKRKQAEKWEKAKREFHSFWRTPFNGVKAIAHRNKVSATCLKRCADHNAKHNHGYDTDSSALVSDSRSDDSWDGDLDATM